MSIRNYIGRTSIATLALPALPRPVDVKQLADKPFITEKAKPQE